jgi:hypothetical protein
MLLPYTEEICVFIVKNSMLAKRNQRFENKAVNELMAQLKFTKCAQFFYFLPQHIH